MRLTSEEKAEVAERGVTEGHLDEYGSWLGSER